MKLEAAAQYGRAVLSGEIPACKWVRLAVQRHYDDLAAVESGERKDIYFDDDEAAFVVDFVGLLRHSKGQWAGQRFELSPWQQFITAVIFGWKKTDTGLRRFKTAYIEVPRKNGKSTWLSAIALFMLVADGEAGAEVYTAATKKEQARLVWIEARRMVESSPALKKRVSVLRNNLSIENTASKCEPLSADANSLDGLNTHAGIIDEVHAHKTPEVWDVLESSTGARQQSLMCAITTAGFNKNGICYDLRSYVLKVLEGVFADDTFFGIVYTIDEGDDWTQVEAWQKANPNYGVSVLPDDIGNQARKAQRLKSAANNFLTKRLNVWVSAETAWANMERWKICGGALDVDELAGQTCYGGLDLASVEDIAAFVMTFPQQDGTTKVIGRYYVPEEKVSDVLASGRAVPYSDWVQEGRLIATPGYTIDYDFIEADIKEAAERYNLVELAYDRWNSTAIVNHLLDAGLEMVQFGQGFASMSAPMKELERLISEGLIRHGDCPVLTWAASNVVAKEDEAGNIKPAKNKSAEKIDPIVALIMALGRQTANEGAEMQYYGV